MSDIFISFFATTLILTNLLRLKSWIQLWNVYILHLLLPIISWRDKKSKTLTIRNGILKVHIFSTFNPNTLNDTRWSSIFLLFNPNPFNLLHSVCSLGFALICQGLTWLRLRTKTKNNKVENSFHHKLEICFHHPLIASQAFFINN